MSGPPKARADCGPPSVAIIHRIAGSEHALFAREFAALASRGDLRVLAATGHRHPDQSGWWGGSAPIDPAVALQRFVPDVEAREVYLCGPAAWMTEVRATVLGLGVSPRHIHAEEFST